MSRVLGKMWMATDAAQTRIFGLCKALDAWLPNEIACFGTESLLERAIGSWRICFPTPDN